MDQGLYTIHTFADVAEELLRALGAGSVHVLAHDVGDTVAQELLARANARQAGAGLTGRGWPDRFTFFFVVRQPAL